RQEDEGEVLPLRLLHRRQIAAGALLRLEEAAAGLLLRPARLAGAAALLADRRELRLVRRLHILEELHRRGWGEEGIEAVLGLDREELEEVALRHGEALGAVAVEPGEPDDPVRVDELLVRGEHVL